MNRNKFLLILSVILLSGCSREFIESVYDVDYTPSNRFAKNLAPLPGQFAKDTDALDSLMNQFSGQVADKWGQDNIKMAGAKTYVKYTDGYLNRADIDFDKGTVTIETIASTDPKAHLKHAIVTTLLTPDNPANVDLFSSKEIAMGGKPFLSDQVVDQNGQSVQWSWRANQFADYLIANKLQTREVDFKTSYYVTIPMVQNHSQLRSYQYADIVRNASKKYDIPEDLIYSIIKTESSFNPYAVSWANAYGLMQIVPKTAGHDVFNLVKGRSGMPTPEYLYNPANNIDTGTAYFHLLKTRYLKAVQNPTSLEYSMISAYNGGTGGVLNTFDSNRSQAMRDLNNLSPDQVYWALTKKHPNAESRRYLEKVTAYQREFNSAK
ncbi:membrane-bound lytic murein transglycosylase MltC [Vibrio rumoiensis]|uniref:Lytic murein transglycosylase n=1 Tax=Vibrio rumoiensis 1S-45 TaxID=1188252 RepID=A0A1E5E553_9VIBR|nr:membrane-bound lytic murein transglycosylase MltC [Vibrio rumoiensis]OEF27734.1 lytic murein transglycosylase [Vibrio rumoiensis 1S-45]